MKGTDRAGRLAEKAIITSGLWLGRSKVLRSLRPAGTQPRTSHTLQGVPLVDFMYLVFTGRPGESCLRHVRSFCLLYLCYVFRRSAN